MSADTRKPAAAKPGAEAAPAAPAAAVPVKSKKMLFAIIGGVFLIGGSVGGYLAMRSAKVAGKTSAPVVAAPVKAAPIYYKFDPPFVVNFGDGEQSRYLQIAVEAMTRDLKVSEGLKENEPAIRNDLLLLYSAQKYDNLTSPEGKESLRNQTLAVIRKTLGAEGYDVKLIEGAYFTSFVIQ